MALIAHSAAMLRLVATARRVAAHTLPVLLTGETGVGKEEIARFIHAASPRCQRELVAVNCAAVPEPLAESEFFGVGKGAYTGAVRERPGYFQQARGSTLFLDELSDMPLSVQTKLLRVLQDGRVRRVGLVEEETVDFRVVAAFNEPGDACVRAGKLRIDLLHRLSVVTLHVLPLRERREDIVPLARHFLQAQGGQKRLAWSAARLLERQDWPGNVRELRNLMTRLSVLYPEPLIDRALLENEMAAVP